MSKSPKKEFSNNNSNTNSDSDSDSDNERSSRANDSDSELDELVSYLSAENRNAFLVANATEAQEFLQKARRARTRNRVRAQGPGSSRFIGPPVPSRITAKRHAEYRRRVKEEQERQRRHEAALKYFAEQSKKDKAQAERDRATRSRTPKSLSRANALRAVSKRKKELANIESEQRAIDAARRRAAREAAREAALQDPAIKRHLKRGYQLVEPSPLTRGETDRNLLRRYLKRFGMRTLAPGATRKA